MKNGKNVKNYNERSECGFSRALPWVFCGAFVGLLRRFCGAFAVVVLAGFVGVLRRFCVAFAVVVLAGFVGLLAFAVPIFASNKTI